ncbi:hypothetical protein CC86DRAFT_370909 [Ophiobolus disseminans]|uniref:Uncharacterized protein n=1 Tax=Ophiobolus disseminans TaxID=1469910 RepID=A0A6A6ZXL2_9PLEO|nr:hypothetical protein CC86DRAFT_370909 [Ophiobolus disseminans]
MWLKAQRQSQAVGTAKTPGMWHCHAAIVGAIVSPCSAAFVGLRAQLSYRAAASRTHDMGVRHRMKEKDQSRQVLCTFATMRLTYL